MPRGVGNVDEETERKEEVAVEPHLRQLVVHGLPVELGLVPTVAVQLRVQHRPAPQGRDDDPGRLQPQLLQVGCTRATRERATPLILLVLLQSKWESDMIYPKRQRLSVLYGGWPRSDHFSWAFRGMCCFSYLGSQPR